MKKHKPITWRLVASTAAHVSLAALARPMLELGATCVQQVEHAIDAGIVACELLDRAVSKMHNVSNES